MPQQPVEPSIFKSRRRDHSVATDVSQYTVTLGATSATYNSEHAPSIPRLPRESKTKWRKRRYRKCGANSIVKHLTATSEHVPGNLPASIALKCIDPTSARYTKAQYQNICKAIAVYRKWGYYADVMHNNGKLFFAIEWLGDEDGQDYLSRHIEHSDLSIDLADVLIAMQGLFQQASQFHQHLGFGIGDLKLDNTIIKQITNPITHQPYAIWRIVDIEGAFADSPVVTLGYMHKDDRLAFLQHVRSGKKFTCSAEMDFRGPLTTIFALLLYASNNQYFLKIDSKQGKDKQIWYDIAKLNYGARAKPHTELVHAMFDVMQKGKNPFQDPELGLASFMLAHNCRLIEAMLRKKLPAIVAKRINSPLTSTQDMQSKAIKQLIAKYGELHKQLLSSDLTIDMINCFNELQDQVLAIDEHMLTKSRPVMFNTSAIKNRGAALTFRSSAT